MDLQYYKKIVSLCFIFSGCEGRPKCRMVFDAGWFLGVSQPWQLKYNKCNNRNRGYSYMKMRVMTKLLPSLSYPPLQQLLQEPPDQSEMLLQSSK